MKYLVQTGATPQLINAKEIDAVGVDDERKTEVRREATVTLSARSSQGHLQYDLMITSG